MKPELTIIPTIKLHPDKVIVYNQYHWNPTKPRSNTWKQHNPQKTIKYDHLLTSKRTAAGKMSKTAKKKVSTAVDYLMLLAAKKTVYNRYSGKNIQFRVAFMTLTLSSKQIHTDNEIKELLLDSFLIDIKRKYRVDRYVWRAEKQENGDIHFHILIDKFIHWSELQSIWNRLQNKLGYVDEYSKNQYEFHKNGFQMSKNPKDKRDRTQQYKAYRKGLKEGFRHPNSTDIHGLRFVKNVKSYVKKYVAKDDKTISELEDKIKAQKESINGTVNKKKKYKLLRKYKKLKRKYNKLVKRLMVKGRIWGCSNNLTGLTGAILEADGEIKEMIDTIKSLDFIKKFEDTYFSIYYFDISELDNRYTARLFNHFTDYITTRFNLPVNYKLNFAA